jgi:WhiB family redox-sensing transcriptional regulator
MADKENEVFADVAGQLDDMQRVPTDVLSDLVTRDGTCMSFPAGPDELETTGTTEREFAAHVCAGCPVRNACLELEFRTAGDATLGVWGGLAEDDRRAVYRAWSQHRQERRGGGRS